MISKIEDTISNDITILYCILEIRFFSYANYMCPITVIIGFNDKWYVPNGKQILWFISVRWLYELYFLSWYPMLWCQTISGASNPLKKKNELGRSRKAWYYFKENSQSARVGRSKTAQHNSDDIKNSTTYFRRLYNIVQPMSGKTKQHSIVHAGPC